MSAFGSGSAFGAGAAFGQKPAGTGLFGSAAPAAGSTNAFGASAAPSNNIFGQSQPAQPAAGNIFGQSAANPAAQPAQNPFGGSIFGNSAAANQPAATNIFGKPAATAANPSAFGATPSPFGAANTGQQQPANESLFGQKPATSNIFGGGAFGGNQTQPLQAQATQPANSNAWGAAGSSIFGQKPAAAPTSFGIAPQTQTQPPVFTRTTKFNDLPDNMKKTLEEIDSHIQGRIQIANELESRNLGTEPTKGRTEILAVHKDLLNLSSDVQNDSAFVRDLKSKADQSVQDTIAATRIVDGFKNPNTNGAWLKNYASFPLEYFIRISEQMKERLQWCHSVVEQIDRKLSSSTARAQSTPQAITATLNAQHAIFISLANKTAALSADLEHIKQVYTQLWRTNTGSMQDPFGSRNLADNIGLAALRS